MVGNMTLARRRSVDKHSLAAEAAAAELDGMRTPRTPASRTVSVAEFTTHSEEAEDAEFSELGESEEAEDIKLVKKRVEPIKHRWNWIPVILTLIFVGASTFYFYVRISNLISPYAVYVLVVELIGLTSFMPYALLLTRSVVPTGSFGLEPAPEGPNGTPLSVKNENLRFHVRALVPCYKEPLEVIQATVTAALNAKLPANTRRTIYLCDDGKSDDKRAFIEQLQMEGRDVVYITGRVRAENEINGKSANLNNCLKTIYSTWPKNDEGQIDWAEISNKEVIVVYDADMKAKELFFCKILDVLVDDDIALCLTPQAFHNVDPDADLFNSINAQFWHYWLPGAFGWGYIACTGTNFAIRARALAHCGWFPDYTITEDYALGMELKKRGYKATYLNDYLAVGEAPEEIRNVFQQRSRWTKGHFQVFFSPRCPLLCWDLPIFQRLWYSYAAWAPICTAITVPTFMLVPFMSVFFGMHPVTITFNFVLASTLYFFSLTTIQFYVMNWQHLKLMWFVNISNVVLWFTYTKALINTFMAKLGLKNMRFKVTEKVKPQAAGAPAAPPTLLNKIGRTMSVVSQRIVAAMSPRYQKNADGTFAQTPRAGKNDPSKDPSSPAVSIVMAKDGKEFQSSTDTSESNTPHHKGGATHDGVQALPPLPPIKTGATTGKPECPISTVPNSPSNKSLVYRGTHGKSKLGGPVSSSATLESTPKQGAHTPMDRPLERPLILAATPSAPLDSTNPVAKQEIKPLDRVKHIIQSFKPQNVSQFDKMFDPLALLCLWIFSFCTFCAGIWQLAKTGNSNTVASFALNSPLSGNPYLIIATLWAFYNSVAPYLFIHYCFTTGPSFKWVTKWLIGISSIVLLGATIIVWMLIPSNFSVQDALSLSLKYYYPNSIPQDTNTNYTFVTGLGATSLEIPPFGDLSGGLLVSDHVKYNFPMAYSLTMMAWGYLQFPNGYDDAAKANLFTTLRAGADYLIRCNLNPNSQTQPLYVAQVGNGADYITYQSVGYDPEAAGKIWTSPWEDRQLNGKEGRLTWVLTKDSVGADLLSGAAAALAAVSIVFQQTDPDFSLRCQQHAKYLYSFATMNDQFPRSYCDFVPCTANITVKNLVVAKKVVENLPGSATCWYVDWIDKSCRIGYTLDECIAKRSSSLDVYTTKLACCNTLQNANVWSGLYTKAQGVCAVPDNQWVCYIPDISTRTCLQHTINDLTGTGCTGKGLEVFATAGACCNYLSTMGVVDITAGRGPSGMCARIGQDQNFTQCYVPSISNATCLLRTGADCESFGDATSYDSPTACCNQLVSMFKAAGFTNTAGGLSLMPLGICTIATNPPALPPSFPTAPGTPSSHNFDDFTGRRHRRLQDTSPAAPPSPTPAVDNSTLWQIPKIDAYASCIQGDCRDMDVDQTVTVTLYNSSSILDDMAWGGVWLYKATLDSRYLGAAQKYIARHYTEDITPQTLLRSREYYVADWDNTAWYVNALLWDITGQTPYRDRVVTILQTWVFGDSLPTDTYTPESSGIDPNKQPNFDNFTVWDTTLNMNVTYDIIPACRPTAIYEDDCFDGIDNDCNGVIDRFDVACGLFPVLYSPLQLAYSSGPSLPRAANAAWLSMVYAESLESTKQRRLRCWALAQVGYMVGAQQGTRSYVVGYGPNPPTIVQNRASSCPTTVNPPPPAPPPPSPPPPRFPNLITLAPPPPPVKSPPSPPNPPRRAQPPFPPSPPLVPLMPDLPPEPDAPANPKAPSHPTPPPVPRPPPPPVQNYALCNWDSGFWPSLANPQLNLVQGALVAGPDVKDVFTSDRRNDDTRISIEGNVGFSSTLGALGHTGTVLRTCEGYHGVYQRYIAGEDSL